MSIVKRFNRLLGLEKIDVLVDEKDKSRHIVITDMPESLPQGKSSFLIEVSPYMRKGIELQIDFIDSKGNSIYVEPVSNLPSANFLAIDEGWGTMDSDNLNSVYNLFQFLKSQFQFTMIVSHIDSMRDAVDTLLEIKKEDNFSKVLFD